MVHIRRPARAAVVALAGSSVAVLSPVGLASARPEPAPRVIAQGLQQPLGLAVSSRGDVYVAQSGNGQLRLIPERGPARTLASFPGWSINGVDVSRGVVSIVRSKFGASPEQGPVAARLDRVLPTGRVVRLADLLAYERRRNPDGRVRYGFRNLPASCAAQLPPQLGPASYVGRVDSNPYAVVRLRDGSRIVADAGGNDLVRVSRTGRIRTVAVLPAQPARITAAAARANRLPACTVGYRYWFEPVPTDVEVGPYGTLYVTLLPGGPEDPSLGARGAVYKVGRNGSMTRIGKDLAGATGLAVTPRGAVYVAELFGGRVSRVLNGVRTTVARLPQPAAIEYARGKLYVTTNALTPGQGQVVRLG